MDLVMRLHSMPDTSPCASLQRSMVKETLLVLALSPRAKSTPKVPSCFQDGVGRSLTRFTSVRVERSLETVGSEVLLQGNTQRRPRRTVEHSKARPTTQARLDRTKPSKVGTRLKHEAPAKTLVSHAPCADQDFGQQFRLEYDCHG